MADERQRIAEEVLAACRILAHRRLCEASGHVSARIPGTEYFLISPRRSLALVRRPWDLVTVDLSGRKVEGAFDPPLETWIDTCLYRARPDVGAVARTHSFVTSVFSILGRPVQPVHNFGAILLGDVRVFPRSELIETEELGTELAAFIGQGTAALLRGNGTVIVGKDVVEACVRAVYLEESALLQYQALQIGEPRYFTPEEVEARGRQLLDSPHLLRAWEHYRLEAGA